MRSSREKLIKDCEFAIDKILCNGSTYVASQQFFKEVIYYLRHYVDVVPCKDCIHATMTADGKMCKYCEMDTDDFGDQREVYHDADWYCADGKRK